jgi:23S rRNA (adenine2503-C2)-methyltransferase
MFSIKSLTLDELAGRLTALGEPAYRAKQVIEWLYLKRIGHFTEMTNLPAPLREKLSAEFDERPLEVVRKTGSDDTTQKFLFRLRDGQMVETVLIPASPSLYGEKSDRRTICISSQVGCAYGCKFCASGLDGWKRNLDAGEIVDQLLRVEAESGERVNNIVFMGMGEPLANFDNLMRAIGIINAPWGTNIGARHITVSTSGLVPRIRDLADQPLQIRLAISLHGATDEVRNRIMPVNRKYPLAELLDACAYFRSRRKQKLTLEFILIEGVNDSLDQAAELARLVKRLDAKVNVIPYNTVEGLDWVRPTERVQDAFMQVLQAGGAVATLRREKGHDIAAACGQLRLQTMEAARENADGEKPVADSPKLH